MQDTKSTEDDANPAASATSYCTKGVSMHTTHNGGEENSNADAQQSSNSINYQTREQIENSADINNELVSSPEIMTTSFDKDPSGVRKRRRKAISSFPFVELPSRTVQRKAVLPDDEFAQSWICAECREAECMIQPDADALVICDGPCCRLFHWPCAGLNKIPEPDQPFYCNDCSLKQHTCAFCQQYGQDEKDVFCCSRKGCGLFFHESCLTMQNVDVNIKDVVSISLTPEGEQTTTTHCKRSFVCPAHTCCVCTQVDEKEQEKNNLEQNEKTHPQKSDAKSRQRRTIQMNKKSSFESKRERFLHRCMVCPLAYHVSCIAPSCRFHELALLCHEHAATYKLPELDTESSLQHTIEQQVDEKYFSLEINRQNRLVTKGKNLFVPLSGDMLLTREHSLREMVERHKFDLEVSLNDDIDQFIGNNLTKGFFLPIDIKKAVEKQPPFFRQISALKYDPTNRPARIPPSETCHCVGFCGDECLNRLLYIECFGDCGSNGSTSTSANGVNGVCTNGSMNGSNKMKYTLTNCSVGPSCGNRQMGRRAFKKCKPARERGKGWGLVTLEKIQKGDLVQEYVGEVIDEKGKEERLQQWSREHPNDPNFYIMALMPGWYIDARHAANLSRFINHSCNPNCILHPINVNGNIRNGVFALKDIAPGEFLNYDYHFDTKHGDRFVCRCGSQHCRGTMKGGVKLDDGSALTKLQIWEEAKAQFEREKKYLAECYDDEDCRQSQVTAMVPGADKADEFVANGVQQRHRPQVLQQRIFLWRSATKGSDFDNRLRRIKHKISRS